MDKNEGIQATNVNIHNAAVGKNAQAHYYTEGEPQRPSQATVTKILLVFANPVDTGRLRLDAEERAIRQIIQSSQYRDNIALTTLFAVTVGDLRQALLKDDFHIVHFAGHGAQHGVVLEDAHGKAYVVPQQALADFFHLYRKTLRCVVLNACYSVSQGHLISMRIPYTIAFEGSLIDESAIEFARGFYDAIGAGKPIDEAYQHGLLTVKLAIADTSFSSMLLPESP